MDSSSIWLSRSRSAKLDLEGLPLHAHLHSRMLIVVSCSLILIVLAALILAARCVVMGGGCQKEHSGSAPHSSCKDRSPLLNYCKL